MARDLYLAVPVRAVPCSGAMSATSTTSTSLRTLDASPRANGRLPIDHRRPCQTRRQPASSGAAEVAPGHLTAARFPPPGRASAVQPAF